MFNTNAFCWNGIVAKDHSRAKSFYADTIGWRPVEHTFENGVTATLFVVDDIPRAHLRKPQNEKEPPRWTSYLRVDDVDAATEAASANGGYILLQPNDIPPGRFSTVASPSGETLSLFHEAEEDEIDNPPTGVGGVHWTELHSTNLQADLTWLEATFAYGVEEMPVPGGAYYVLNHEGKPRGGVVAARPAEFAGGWLTWIHVDELDDTLDRVNRTDGTARTEIRDHPGVGRLAIVADPEGAAFGIIKPAS